MKNFIVRGVLISSSMIASQGFGMIAAFPQDFEESKIRISAVVEEQIEIETETIVTDVIGATDGEQISISDSKEEWEGLEQKVSERLEEIDPVIKMKELEQKISEQQSEMKRLSEEKKKLSEENRRLFDENEAFKKGDPLWIRNEIQKEALKYYNARLRESKKGESEEQEVEAKMLPNINEVEETLYEFFNNIDEKLPELERLEAESLEKKEEYLNEIARIVNRLHSYMDECLIPFKYGYKSVYTEHIGHFVPCQVKTLMPTNPKNYNEPWKEEFVSVSFPLIKVIEELEKQLAVTDALLQAAELSYQTEYKKDIFREDKGCHVLYIEAWNETSRKNLRLKEIEKRRRGG